MLDLLSISLFGVVVGIQLLFYIFIFLRWRSYQNEKAIKTYEPISVIICAHDELDNIKELIPLLLKQEFPLFEVIIVDDRSNDDTFDFLLEETKKYNNLRMVKVDSTPERVGSKKFALTLGIKAARYEHLLLTDADCRPVSNNWLSEMEKGFQNNKEIVLGFSPYIKEKGFLNLLIRYETLYTAIQYLSFALIKFAYMGVGRNLAYTKSLFLNNKGFNSHIRVMSGDDDLFVNHNATTKNVSVVIHPDAKIYSFPKQTWKSWYRQKKRHLSVGKRYKFKHKFVLGLLSFSQVFFWIFFILSLILSHRIEIAIGLFFAKVICMLLIFQSIFKKLGEKLPIVLLPVLDFMYSIYFVCVGALALFSKKTRWN